MKQMTFGAMTGFEKHTKVTRRAQFLAEMNQVVPWSRLLALIEPYYPQAGNGRPPKAPKAQDFTNEKGRRNAPLTEAQKAKNKTKSKVRAAVEHPFLTIKQLFKFTKVCYKGLQKNAHRFFVACGLANLHRVRHFLMRQDRRGAFASA